MMFSGTNVMRKIYDLFYFSKIIIENRLIILCKKRPDKELITRKQGTIRPDERVPDLGHFPRSLVPDRKEARRPMSGYLIFRSAMGDEILLVCEASVR